MTFTGVKGEKGERGEEGEEGSPGVQGDVDNNIPQEYIIKVSTVCPNKKEIRFISEISSLPRKT